MKSAPIGCFGHTMFAAASSDFRRFSRIKVTSFLSSLTQYFGLQLIYSKFSPFGLGLTCELEHLLACLAVRLE
jgi:hypothetical protein